MDDKQEIIVEITDNLEFVLKEEILKDILSKANGCHEIAVISSVGPRLNGNTFVMNCLLNYLRSQYRNVWPKCEDSIVTKDNSFSDDSGSKRRAIKMWSKPFVIEDNDRKIAVFLIDSQFIFTEYREPTQLMRDAFDFLMTISSTVICCKSILLARELRNINEMIGNNSKTIENKSILSELTIILNNVVTDSHQFSSFTGGKQYLKYFVELHDIDMDLESMRCYLMPLCSTKVKNSAINLAELDENYVCSLRTLIKSNLLDNDKMQTKKNIETKVALNVEQLFDLFGRSFENLNCNEFVDDLNLDIDDRKFDLDEKKMKHNMSSLTGSKYSPEYYKRNDSELNLNSSQTSFESTLLTDCESIDSDLIEFTDSELSSPVDNSIGSSDNGLVFCRTLTVNDDNSSYLNLTFTSDSCATEENNSQLKVLEVSRIESIKSDEDEVIDEKNDELNSSQSNAGDCGIVGEINDNKERTDGEREEFLQFLIEKYRNDVIMSVIKEMKINNKQDINKWQNVCKDEIRKIINKDVRCGGKKGRKDYKEMLDTFMDIEDKLFEENINNKIQEMGDECERIVEESIEVYVNKLAHLFSGDENNFDVLHERAVSEAKMYINEESKKFSENDNNCVNYFTDLDKTFQVLNIEYRNAFIKFNADWNSKVESSRVNSVNEMRDYYQNSLNNIIETDDERINRFLNHVLETYLSDLEEKNREIEKSAERFADEMIEITASKYEEMLNSSLKCGVYSQNDVEIIHQNLLQLSLNSLHKACNFNDKQRNLIEKCEQKVKDKISTQYRIIRTNNQQNIEKVIEIFKTSKSDAIKGYCDKINKIQNIDVNEFRETHERIARDVMDEYRRQLSCCQALFNADVYENLICDSVLEVEDEINAKKLSIEAKIKKLAPKLASIAVYFGKHCLIGAVNHSEVKYILNKWNTGVKERFNSIAFTDNMVLCGLDARDYYYRNFNEEFESFYGFDVRSLIPKNNDAINDEILDTYPFVFDDNQYLRVNIDCFESIHDLSVEALIALLIIDIKKDAETAIKKSVSKIVLTVPTNFNIRQRNSLSDSAKIAGFNDIVLLSEMSAAAVGYASYKQFGFQELRKVLIIVLNDYECDAGVYLFMNKNIEMISYCHQNLLERNESNESNIIKFKNYILSYFWTVKERNNEQIISKNFVKLLNALNCKQFKVDDIVIAGNSEVMMKIKVLATYHLNGLYIFDCNPTDIIIDGAAVYIQNFSNCHEFINISEIAIYPISCQISSNFRKNLEIIDRNQLLPRTTVENIYCVQSNEFPIYLDIQQNNDTVLKYTLELLSNASFNNWPTLQLSIELNNFGDIRMNACFVEHNKCLPKNVSIVESKLGLTDNGIADEKRKVKLIESKAKQEMKTGYA